MKFKTLNINNIASIETAKIDFQEVYFANESLFLIYGDTGSGKTTILDAICLALYKETPRMKQSKSDKYVDESLMVLKNGENDGIQVSDERQYMRRGTKSAFVELTFLGNDEKNYTARIEFGVARTGNLQKTIWTLTTGNTIFDRDKDIKNAINNAIGLDYEQFCRTTMLAQGEFTKFLRSDEKDKSGILEKLTGTDIYSKIGAKIYQRFKAKEDELKLEQAKLGEIQLLDDEAIENLQKEMLQLRTNNETQSQQRSVLSSRKTWLETENQLKKDCQTAEDALNKWNDIALQSDYQIQRQTIAQWHNTTEERRAFHFLKELRQEKESNNNLEQSLKLQFSKLVAGDAWNEQEIQKKTLEIKDIQSFLNEQKPFVPMYAESQTINVKLIQYINDIKESSKYYHQVEAEQKKLLELEKVKNINNSKRDEIEALLEAKNKEILQQQQQLDALNKKDLQQKNNQCQTLLNEIQIAENQLNRRDEAKADLDSMTQQEIETDRLIKSLNQKKDEFEPQLTQAKKEVEQAELLLNKSKESVGDYAKAMRAILQLGDRCPVCGQKVIHLERDEDFEKALQPVLQNFKDKKSEFEKIQTTINQFNADIKAQTLSLKTIQKNCNDKRMFFETMVEQTNDSCAKIGVDANSMTLLDDIQQLKNQQNEELQNVQQSLHQVDEWQKKVNNLQKEKEQLIEKQNIAKDAVLKSEHAIEQCRNLIQRSSDLAIQKQQSAEEAKKSVAEKILYPDWEQNIETTLRLLKDDTKEYANQVEKNQSLSNALTLEKNNQEQSKVIRQQIENNFPLWQVEVSMKPVENLNQEWSRLLEKTISLKTKKAKNEEETKNNLQKINQFFTANDNFQPEDLTRLANISQQTINQWEQNLKELDEKGQLLKGALESVKCQQQKHWLGKPTIEKDETPERLLELLNEIETEISKNNERIVLINNQISENENQRKRFCELQKKMDLLNVERQQWAHLCRLFGDAEGKSFRKIAQCYVLRELLEQANYYLKYLSKRYELHCQNDSLTILVSDSYFGGIARPVDLVSGGESFVVSLALALGLSSLNHNSFATDILFIDEGFGTLDADTLEIVMDTLSRLRDIGGRRVGIISHVEQLRERITAKISLEKISNNSSRVRMEVS